MDNDSQEYILTGDDGIKRTIETNVTSEGIPWERFVFAKDVEIR
jgi:hypothetical protein